MPLSLVPRRLLLLLQCCWGIYGLKDVCPSATTPEVAVQLTSSRLVASARGAQYRAHEGPAGAVDAPQLQPAAALP